MASLFQHILYFIAWMPVRKSLLIFNLSISGRLAHLQLRLSVV